MKPGQSVKKRFWRGLRIAFCCGFFVLLLALLINLYVLFSTKPYRFELADTDSLKGDCILVLGAGLKKDGTPNHMLRDRLDYGYELYKKGVADRFLLSGDHGNVYYDEVNAMKIYLLDKGVPEDALYLDHAGFSTYDSMYRAKAVFCVEKPVIVTQDYHLSRAVYVARRLGLDAVGVSSDPYRYVRQMIRDIREVFARVKDFGYALFQPQPTYLGEPIPVQSAPSYLTNG